MNNIKNRLKSILETKFHGNHSEMARVLNVSPPTIKNYTEEDRLPKYDFVFRTCVKLGINPNWLILGIGDKFIDDNKQGQTTFLNLGTGNKATQIINKNEDNNHLKLQIENLNDKNIYLERENNLLREMIEVLKNNTSK